MSNGLQLASRPFDNPNAAGKARGDFLGLLLNLANSAWKFSQRSQAQQGVRRALNDAVYALSKRPEGYYVIVQMAGRDVSAGALRGMIQFTSATASTPAPISGFHIPASVWPAGTRVFHQVIHNVQGVCPRNLPSDAMNLDQARQLLGRL
ncbi:MAG: hypothetical protein RLZZ437_920 [Pseudomonadota bacterium]